MEQILMFPTPLFVDTLYCDDNVKSILASAEIKSNDTDYTTNYGYYSNNIHMLDLPELNSLKENISKISKYILSDVFCFKIDEGVKITQSWVTLKKSNQTHGIHNHPNSILSGVYYFEDTDDITPITFHKGNVSSGVFTINIEYDRSKNNFLSWDKFDFKPKPNNVIFFPSYLQHSVGVNLTQKDRKCLAFNVVPVYGFGFRNGLSNLLF